MSARPFIRQTKPEDMSCKVIPCEPDRDGVIRQFNVQNNYRGIQDWDREYVGFGGYFGTHGPYMFAAAPELFEALQQARERMIGSSPAIVKLRNLTDAAIAKATGQ